MKTVLVVDDERLLRWSLARRLARAGYEVIEAGSGLEALSVGERHVDMILLDVRLPDADGFSLLRDFRRERPDCPVVMMSAYATPERVQEAKDLGALTFMAKPFDVEKLVGVVDVALR